MKKNPLISVRHLSKRFSHDIRYNMYYGLLDVIGGAAKYEEGDRPTLRKKEFWAVDDVNFDLYAGDILGIVGMNGSGKTTLMRLISGVYPLDYGQIQVREGSKITAIFALGVGMQSLFTGRENIFIKGAMFGMTEAEIRAKLDFIEAFSELGSKLDTPFGNYSSGMRARLGYAIAMASEPDIFIIDEALAVGDAAFRAKCMENLKAFVKRPGKGVIFVSNHIKKVMKIATRTMVMERGSIIHASHDIKESMEFYLANFYRDLPPHLLAEKIRNIHNYEF